MERMTKGEKARRRKVKEVVPKQNTIATKSRRSKDGRKRK